MILICSWNLLNQPPSFQSFQCWKFLLLDVPSLSACQRVESFIYKTAKETHNISNRKREREKGKYWVTGPLLDSWPLLWAQASCTPQPGLWGSLCTAILFSFTKVCWSESPRTVFSSEDQQCIFTAAPDMQHPACNTQHPACSTQHAACSIQHPTFNLWPLSVSWDSPTPF